MQDYLLPILKVFMTKKIYFLFLLLSVCISNTVLKAQDCFNCNYDSLLIQLPKVKSDSDRVKLLTLLIDKSDNSLSDRTLEHIGLLLEANRKENLADTRPYVEMQKGILAWKKGDYRLSLSNFKNAISLFDTKHKIICDFLINVRNSFAILDLQDEKKEYYLNKLSYYQVNGPYQNAAACYHALGSYYLSKADYNLSITNYLRAANLYKRFAESYYYNELIVVGNLYDKWGNLDKAKYYLNLGLPLSKARGDSNITAYALIALSSASLKNQQYNLALKYTDEAISYSNKNRPVNTFDAIYAVALLQKGLIYVYQNHPDTAYNFLIKSKTLSDQFHPKITTAAGDLELDYTFYLYNLLKLNYTAAGSYLESAYKKAVDEKSNVLQKKYLRELFTFYQNHQQLANASEYIKRYFILNDLLEKEQNSVKIAQFENEQKEQEQSQRIITLRQEKAIQDIKISNRNLIMSLTIMGLIIVCGLSVFIYRQLIVNKNTLKSLKKTQRQLILSEKMASLGEMASGIAHEIQNPLNFVKNFSEVTIDIAGEMNAEIEKGNVNGIKQLSSELQENLDKIIFHSNKADSIVKGLMTHTRKVTGHKEMIDLNKLIDEHVHISLQAYKATDKKFEVEIVKNYDVELPVFEGIPQEIGVVLMNLFNNAFYSVGEKRKRLGDTYHPTIWISSSKFDEQVCIKIKDNGQGIPAHITDKIFQPFYTTKPTGQFTGLGLSLSYDIITKGHDGKMNVETVEGEYAEFVITL